MDRTQSDFNNSAFAATDATFGGDISPGPTALRLSVIVGFGIRNSIEEKIISFMMKYDGKLRF